MMLGTNLSIWGVITPATGGWVFWSSKMAWYEGHLPDGWVPTFDLAVKALKNLQGD